jgi:hypothetical protein
MIEMILPQGPETRSPAFLRMMENEGSFPLASV